MRKKETINTWKETLIDMLMVVILAFAITLLAIII
jgi:hypothetical protein